MAIFMNDALSVAMVSAHTGTVSNRMSLSAAGGGGWISINKPRQKPKP
jgi:type IV secretory pathway VirJ component